MECDPLTQDQLRGLGMLLHTALKEIRLLGWDGKAEQSADLADALCQLPLRMHSGPLDWEQYEQSLGDYAQRYPDRNVKFDYAGMLRRIMTSE
jgi:hypothetical protein